ncbi:MBL fold metallo-hydrolase [Puerhibacterium sp. TATVAM-FAB25]|uniref:MBL fold metallo-hydrolase n=1 Tax=Puerhibacterium sp. TATVAM-FAB25 TaxID=3093699 RepID=UPI00397D6FBA
MRLVTVGVAGSFPGPDSPASCYVVQVPAADVAASPGLVAAGVEARDWTVVLDLGNGGLGALQRHVDPSDVDAVALSHLHPDHCSDLSGLYVYLRYHPARGSHRTGVDPHLPVIGPAAVAERAHAMYGMEPGETMDGVFAFRTWTAGRAVQVGPLTITPYRVFHPVEAYGLRVAGPSSVRPGETVTLAYTGDTDLCDGVVELARGVDLLLSEAAFEEGRDDGVEPGIHLTGRRAGQVAARAEAKRLVLTHLPAWSDPRVALAEARGEYGGPAEVAATGNVYEL